MIKIGEKVTLYAIYDRQIKGEVVAFNGDGIEIKNKDGHYYYLYMEIEHIKPES